MGTDSNFCDCKNSSNGSCISLSLNEIKSMICPVNNSNINSKREFLSNSVNQILTIDEHIKKQAVNKIIKAYRAYKINKEEKLKFNSDMNVNNNNSYDMNDNNESNDNKLKHRKQKKVNFLEDEANQNDKKNNSLLEYNPDNKEYFHTNESQNSENRQSSKRKQFINNRNKKNKYSKNHDSLSDRLRNSMSSIKTFYTGGGTKDQKEGFGINLWSDEAKYIGYYKNNKAEGYGKFIAGNDIFKGEFKDDAANGFGTFNNGIITYEGYWVKDLQETYGIETWEDGSIYKGEYLEGKKSGIGVYSWPDGTRYEGMWENNTFNGFGIFYFSGDRYYYGEWKDKKKEGFGEFIWPEKKYIGFYSDDKRHGLGITIWKDDRKAQIGFWKEGKQFGLGKFMNKKKVYFGIWKENNKVDWFKNQNEGMEYLEKNRLQNYKKIFGYNLEQLYDFCYNKDDIENIMMEQDKTKNDDL
jgi:hypothetical protein